MCFECSKEPSHRDGSFEYPQGHNIWFFLRIHFQMRTLIWRHICFPISCKMLFIVIGLDEQNFWAYNCKYFLTHLTGLTNILGDHKVHVCFGREIRKNIFGYTSLTRGLHSNWFIGCMTNSVDLIDWSADFSRSAVLFLIWYTWIKSREKIWVIALEFRTLISFWNVGYQ